MRPASVRRLGALVAVAVGIACTVTGCGASQEPPVLVAVNGYLNAIGNGDYASACALLDPAARRALERAAGRRDGCPRALERCLPNNALASRHDQTQLLYADVQFHVHGYRGDAEVSGTAVAREIRRVTLAREHRRWLLTTFAQGIRRCRLR